MIPKNWYQTSLKNVSNLYIGTGINEKIRKQKYFGNNDGFVYITTKDINFNGEINYNDNFRIPKSAGYKFAPSNTALLCVEGASAGRKIAFINQPVFFTNKFCAFVAKNINSKYIYYFLQTPNFIEKFNSKKHGVIGGVSMKDLKLINIPVPPIDEQQRIVDIIDRLFEKLNKTYELAQNIVTSYEIRYYAILHKALTGELTDSNFKKWKSITLEKILLPMQRRKPHGEYFKYIDIESIDNKRQKIREAKIVKTEAASGRANRGVDKDNVLFSLVRPYLRNIAIVEEEYEDSIVSTGFYVCRCKKDILPKYLYNVLRSQYAINYYQQFIKGFNAPSIRIKDFLSLKIKLPPLREQEKITALLDDLIEKEYQAKEIAEQILPKIELIKKSVLNKAFRGELKTFNI